MVSIIIPSMKLNRNKNPRYFYKALTSLPDLIKSISTNVNIDYEIIVIVNGEKDQKLIDYVKHSELIDKYAIVNLNTGVSRAWNIGRNLAEGDALLYINDDVVLGKKSVFTMYEYLMKHSDVGEVGPKGGLWDVNGSGPRKGLHEIEFADEISGFCFLVKTKIFDEVGGFDTYYTPAGAEEIDFSFKIRKNGYKCIVIPGLDIKTEPRHGISARDENIIYFNKRINTKDLAERNMKYFNKKWFS